MARKSLPKINLTGISTEKLINMSDEQLMDLARSQFKGVKLTANERSRAVRQAFATITSRLVSTANKRVKRLGKTESGRMSPAYINYMKHNKLSVRGKSWNQLRNTFKTTKQWLKYKTSTASGWKAVRTDVEKRIGFMTKYESKKFWKAYRELEELNGGFVDKSHKDKLSSDQIQSMLYNEVNEKGWRTKRTSVVDSVNEKIKDIYEEQNSSDEEDNYEDLFDDLEDAFD